MKNFQAFNDRLKEYVLKYGTKPCLKLSLDNLVFPQWSELGLLKFALNFNVLTAENPFGQSYPCNKYQLVLRAIDGHLLFEDMRRDEHLRSDSYCWTIETVNKNVANGKTRPIGTASAEGLLNLVEFMNGLKSEKDKELLATTFALFDKDILLIHSDEESRSYIPVTKEIVEYFGGSIVDEWQVYSLDADGNAVEKEICVGDAIIVTVHPDGHVTGYRVDKKMFEETYSH